MSLITENEVGTLMMALASGQESFTEEEATKVVLWAEEARLNSALVTLVLNGIIDISIVDDDLAFRRTNKAKTLADYLPTPEELFGVGVVHLGHLLRRENERRF